MSNQDNTNDIEQKVITIVADQLGLEKEKVTPESSFVDDLEADSMDIAELVMALEDNFSIKIPEQEEGGIRTVKSAIDYIKNYKSK